MKGLPNRKWGLASLLTAGVVAAAIGTFAVGAAGQAPSPGAVDMVATERDAYLLAPPRLIESGETRRLTPSPAGRYLLYASVPLEITPDMLQRKAIPDTEVRLALWDARMGKGAVLWRAPLTRTRYATVDEVRWFPGGSAALATVRTGRNDEGQEEGKLLLVDAVSATARPLVVPETVTGIALSPQEPLAVLSGHEPSPPGRQTLRVVSASGNRGPLVTLPFRASPTGLWSPDGRVLYYSYAEPAPAPAEGESRPAPRRLRWLAFDTRTSRAETLEQAPKGAVAAEETAPSSPLPLRLDHRADTLQTGRTKRQVRPLWLEGAADGKQPQALVSADCDDGLLLADASAVVYRSKGVLFAVTLMRIDLATLEAMRREAQKAATLSNGKQIALGVLMYSQDYDEQLPPADKIQEVLEPYLKNQTLFNQVGSDAPAFAYVYKGPGDLASIPSPAETIMGYLYGPGGRAVIYIDGHVKWQEEKDYPGETGTR